MKRTVTILAVSSSLALVLSAQPAMASTGTSTTTAKSSSTSSSTSTSGTASKTTSGSTNAKSTSSKAIYFDGHLMSNPSGFVRNGTTYIPIWYVAHALAEAGITNTWKNGVMNFTVPSSVKLTLKPASSQSGTVKISIDGKIVETSNGIVAVDPASNHPTEYLPIWYVMQALNQMKVSSQWDGTNWHLKMTTPAQTGTSNPASGSGGSGTTSSSSGKGSSGSSTGSAGGSTSASGSSSGSSSSSTPGSGGSTGGSTGTGSSSSSGSTSSTSGGSGSTGSSGGSSSGSGSSSSGSGSGGSGSSVPPTAANIDDLIGAIMGTSDFSQLPKLSSGATGIYVSALQSLLLQLGYPVSVTGTYDALTVSAVQQFEQSQAMTRDGVVTPAVWQALQQTIMSIPATPQGGTGTSSSSSSGSSGSTSPSQPSGTGFPNVDLRFAAPSDINAASIDSFLQSQGSPMDGLGQTFIAAQNTFGVDANYLVSHAILESNWGVSQIAQAKNNLFGYGAYDSAPGQDAGLFPSNEYAILFQGWEVRNNYLNPGASEYVAPTLIGMNVHYATDPQWASSIGHIMSQLATSVNDSVSSYTQYTPGQQAPAPSSSQEPIYYTQAAATVRPVSNYPGLPYYSSPGVGASEMFFTVLQQGSAGASVATVQTFLNQTMNAGLQVDGQFGPMTKQAVIAFQAAHGLPQTGQWSFAMWQMFNQTPTVIPSGQQVTVSKIAMGMANGIVVEWDYVNGYGWVDSQYLQMQNVYRAMALQPKGPNTTILVYGPDKQSTIQTIHSGDFVIATTPTPQAGFYAVTVFNQSTGQALSGYISTAQANLVQLQ